MGEGLDAEAVAGTCAVDGAGLGWDTDVAEPPPHPVAQTRTKVQAALIHLLLKSTSPLTPARVDARPPYGASARCQALLHVHPRVSASKVGLASCSWDTGCIPPHWTLPVAPSVFVLRGQRPTLLAPYLACALVKPSNFSCLIRPDRENDVKLRYSLAFLAACLFQSTCCWSTP